MITIIKHKDKKEKALVLNKETETLTADIENQNFEVIDIKEIFGLESDNLKRKKISRSESCI